MAVLIVAIEAGRMASARLPQPLAAAGLTVTSLCPEDNLLAHSQHIHRHILLPATRSVRRLARALVAAVADCSPRFIIPADRQVVALLHSLLCGRHAGLVPHRVSALIAWSLGNHAQFGAMLFKSHTLALARELDIAVPRGRTVAFGEQAVRFAAQTGYPVFVKESFSSAGKGVSRCENAEDVRAAFPSPGVLSSRLNAVMRHLSGRDWYPVNSPTDVQVGVHGEPALYCALAWQGRMIGGFAGTTLEQAHANGPSVALRIGHDERLAAVAEKMIAALGCTGFVGFDFMVETGSGRQLLIDCNPVPTSGHLGARIGVDLVAELAALLRGAPARARAKFPTGSLDVLLFPYALDAARHRPGMFVDVPWQDQSLVDYVIPSCGDPDP